MTFANQVAVITGASSGIGSALAKALAREGCKVGLVARRRDRLQALADEIHAAGGTAAVAPADVGDRAQTVAAIRDLAARLGPVDLLVANAGVGAPTTFEPLNVEAQVIAQPAAKKTCLLLLVSPSAKESAAWQTLRAIGIKSALTVP